MKPLSAFLLGLYAITLFAAAEPAAPEEIDDGWQTAAPASLGLDARSIVELLARTRNGTYKNIHGLVIAVEGKLAVEAYFKGKDAEGAERTYDRDTLHSLQSVTKSVASLLVGIAIDQGKIKGIDEPLFRLLPAEPALPVDGGKDAILLRHALAMSAGFTWKESRLPYPDPRNDANGLNRSRDPVRFVFERALATPPGREYFYNSGLSIVVGEVLRHSTGLSADQFAALHLFGPMGITQHRWNKLANDAPHTGGGLWLRPRDLAKIGQLCLDGGRWGGKQIVSTTWVSDSTRQQAPYSGYGYQWWLHSFRGRTRALDAYAAQGYGGQVLFVIPDLKLVVVATGWNEGPLAGQPFQMLQRYIIPAVEKR